MTNRNDSSFGVIEMSALVYDVVDSFRDAYDEHDIDLEAWIPDGIAFGGDSAQLQQALIDLLEFTLDRLLSAQLDDPYVSLSASVEEHGVNLFVKDEAPEIDSSAVQAIIQKIGVTSSYAFSDGESCFTIVVESATRAASASAAELSS
ncbi:MAG: hypothetical protein AAF226_13265 [Verrucomicrobiota bacterium]